jgi:hypothetical protein
MMRNRQFPWLSHQIVLKALVLMRAVRRKPTVNGENRPIAVSARAEKRPLNV